MDHDRAERLIGERLDGEHLPVREARELERHVAGCAECRAFERGARRLREAARFEVAPAVPDLVEPIMSAVEDEAHAVRPGLRLVRAGERRRRRVATPRLLPLVAAAVVGALVGSLVVGGPWAERGELTGRRALAAEDVTRGVAAAAGGLDAYEARFDIDERNLSSDVPERRLSMRVWFRAPERFRLDVVDRTTDPATATPTDLRLIVDEDRWYVAAPAPCPSSSCPMRETSVRNRVPFSSSAPAPTDLVLPLTALGAPDDVDVLGGGSVLGRAAVRVQVPFDRAASLFPFLSLGGDWRPFFPNDRVRIWLDAEDWFPLRWEVLPAPGARREAWSSRFGLPNEAPSRPVFSVVATHVSRDAPDDAVFAIPATANARDQGAREVPLARIAREAGFTPLLPREIGGLEPYRAVVPVGGRDAPGTVVTFADGLAFLKIAETRTWSNDAPFGPVDVHAEQVPLGGGVGYFEPATAARGRVLAVHAAGADLYLETNLPRERLLALAAGLPVTGLPMPAAWMLRRSGDVVAERVTLEQARAAVPFAVAAPDPMPAGLTLASVELVRGGGATGVTLYLRAADVDTGAGTIRIHLQRAAELPPPSAARQFAVDVAGGQGRWTPERSTLEWVADGVYRAVVAPGSGLDGALRIAASVP